MIDTNYSNYVSEINTFRNMLTITGKANFTESYNSIWYLYIKKRGSSISYDIPIKWEENNFWTTDIDVETYNFQKGVWDYYLKNNKGQKERLKIANKEILENCTELFYYNEDITRIMTCYITKNDSFSTESKPAIIEVQNLTGQLVDNGTSLLEGQFHKNGFTKFINTETAKVIIKERKTLVYNAYPLTLHNNNGYYFFRFKFNIKEYELIQSEILEEAKCDVYIQLNVQGEDHLFRIKTDNNNLSYDTNIELTKNKTFHLYFYKTVNNYLSLALAGLEIKRDVTSYTINNGKLNLKGYAYLKFIDSRKGNYTRTIVIRKRNSDKEIKFPITNNEVIAFNEENSNYFDFNVHIPLEKITEMHDSLKEVYDFYIQMEYANERKEKKIGCENYTYFVDEVLDEDTSKRGFSYFKNYLLYTPHGNLKLETYTYSRIKLWYLKYGHKLNKIGRRKNIWLIGERPDTAQDTGYHFFKYCRHRFPEKEIYYVVDKNSPDLKNLKGLGNVIYFGSMQHFIKASMATTFIGSHDLEYILPTKAADWPNYQEGNRIFLQHGILGRKKVDYYKHFYKYPFNLFLVSSDAEYELVNNEMGYDKHEIEITGLSRFDSLLTPHKEEQSIIIIPTWRDWLNEYNFLNSHYYKVYTALLTDEKLNHLLQSYNMKLKFYTHYRMQHFIDYFKKLESEYVDIIKFGESDVHQLIKQNKLLITDYSSVSFDFNYMSKPAVFYHFDYKRFFKNGILRPTKETFLGDICETKDQLVCSVEHYLQNEFKESPEAQNNKHLIFNFVDNQNNNRIFKAINNLTRKDDGTS